MKPSLTPATAVRFAIQIGAGLVALTLWTGCGKPAAPASTAPLVEFVAIQQADVPIYREWVGTLSGDVNATITAQVSGYVTNRAYQEGKFVTNGQVLFQIDPASFETALARAQAQLAQAVAVKNRAKLDVGRYTSLAQTEAISKQELDNAIQADLSAGAQVAVAEAEVLQAKLDLGFTTIRSPIDGVAGLATAQVGDLVGPSVGALTTVSKINPIRVNFAVSEQILYRTLIHRTETNHANGTENMILDLLMASGDTYPQSGRISFTGNQVDAKTGTLQVVGEFPNALGVLLPGMFARVRAMVGVETNALLVPQRAVADVQGHRLVAVIGTDHKISIRPVTAGEMVGDKWIIGAPGLKAGDHVVAEGIQKVRDGLTVNPVPFGTAEEKAP